MNDTSAPVGRPGVDCGRIEHNDGENGFLSAFIVAVTKSL